MFEYNMDDCITGIKKIIRDKNALWEIKNENLNRSILQTLENCLAYCFSNDFNVKENMRANKLLEINSALDFLHDELNTGHWSEVSINVRHYFTLASFLKCIIFLKHAQELTEAVLKECLKSLDMGILLGAPLDENSELLTNSAKFVMKMINELVVTEKGDHHGVYKRKLEDFQESHLEKIPGSTVQSEECPSLEYFNNIYFIPQVPVKLKGCMSHWPAISKWIDINYLLEVAGDRTVPIEIGSQYVDDNWSQKLMTLREFIKQHYLSDNNEIGYLAQHNLFEQITELKEDILIPEYCCLSFDYENSVEPDINAWLGPKGTVSPLHHDPKNNILAQIYGYKQIILFSPKDSSYLYPHEDKLLNNTAQVNPLEPNLEKFPKFSESKMYKCLLGPEEMLFIPAKWWHHVSALEKSFSVSFWWN